MKEIAHILEDNILNWWGGLADRRGGFFGQVDGNGNINKDASRGAVLNARILWTFSVAYRLLGKKEYLLNACNAKEYFIKHFIDHKYGGVYWSVGADGEREDSKAQLYAQGFAIYGLSEFYAATGDEEALKAAINIYKITEAHFADHENGGYIEALDRDFSPLGDMRLSDKDKNVDKTMNSHLHVLEGYASLYKVWPDAELKKDITDLMEILRTKIFNAGTGHLNLYFDKAWNVIGQGISYGHDIETSWLALECAFILKDFDEVNKIKPICKILYKGGMQGYQNDGSLIYEIHDDGTVDDSRQWWVEAETVVANLWAWKYLDVEGGDAFAQKTLDYIKSHLINWKDGEWYWDCDAQGRPNVTDDKAGPWKCPYHNGRMCFQALTIF